LGMKMVAFEATRYPSGVSHPSSLSNRPWTNLYFVLDYQQEVSDRDNHESARSFTSRLKI